MEDYDQEKKGTIIYTKSPSNMFIPQDLDWGAIGRCRLIHWFFIYKTHGLDEGKYNNMLVYQK